MKRQNKLLFINILATVLLVSACSTVKQELGVARNSPDEFTVVKRAPLTLPPEYNLVPPLDANDPAAIAHQENSMRSSTAQAQEAVFGNKSETKAEVKKAAADNSFLTKLKADSANPNVRKLIEEDNGYISFKNESLVDKLTSSDEDAANINVPESIVDPKAEDKRIKENIKTNKPVNAGDVPVIEKKQTTLDKIF